MLRTKRGLSAPRVNLASALHRRALRGKHLGVDWKYFDDPFWGSPDAQSVMDQVLEALKDLGAQLIDVTTDPEWMLTSNEFDVLLYEFKVQIAEYLATLRRSRVHTLADLIAFNLAHCEEEMKYFGQEIFEWAEATSGDLISGRCRPSLRTPACAARPRSHLRPEGGPLARGACCCSDRRSSGRQGPFWRPILAWIEAH